MEIESKEELNNEISWALEHSRDNGKYPNIFSNDYGMDLNIEGYFVEKKKNRKVAIEISSYRGICSEAVHYYAKIKADGVYVCSMKMLNGEKRKVVHGGYLGEEFEKLPKEKKDSYNSIYEIEVVRKVTKEEIENNPDRWNGYREGWMTDAFESKEELIEIANRIVKARFDTEWKVEICEYL